MDSELKQAILELVRVMDRIGFNGRAQPNGARCAGKDRHGATRHE